MSAIYLKQSERYIGQGFIDPKLGKANADGYIRVYTVIKLIGSIRYDIEQELSVELVADLCDQTEVWKVIIT